ncbi:MAG: hypothetical protein IJW59_02870 [Clostridia bacterium]|nr:hypothetical protein [Clostridia bacterium]
MNTLKKTIFLSNNEKSKSMGIVTLEKRNSSIFGTLKVYQNYPNSNYILGIKNEDKIVKQNVNLETNSYNFILNENIDLNKNIGCVLLESNATKFEPIIWGSQRSDSFKSSILNSLRESVNKLNLNKSEHIQINQQSIVQNENVTPLTLENSDTEENNVYQESISDLLKQNENQDVAIHPFSNITAQDISTLSQIQLDEEIMNENTLEKSDIAIASTASLFETEESELNDIIDRNINKESLQNNSHEFYDMIAEQLDDLFEKYPKEPNLEKLIDNSKWIKIDSDYDNKYYVVGIIYNNNDVKYVCYGVPGSFQNEPPREMIPYSQWFPTNPQNPHTEGYWVMYQDADTGENIFLS